MPEAATFQGKGFGPFNWANSCRGHREPAEGKGSWGSEYRQDNCGSGAVSEKRLVAFYPHYSMYMFILSN